MGLLPVGQSFASRKNLQTVKVEIVQESSGFEGKYRQGGLVGAVGGTKTFTTANTTKAIINGDHALLVCYEHHKGCNVLGVGTYNAEIETHGKDRPDVWIYYVRPIDHKTFREHWQVSGSW